MSEPSADVDAWTFAIVDLAGYTALTESHGDEHAAELAMSFAGLAKSALARNDRLVKPIGDAVLLASETPLAGLELVDRLLTAASELEGFPLARAGLHHGPAVQRDGDVFGAAVNLAARVAAQASGGQTLVTGHVADVARKRGKVVTSVGTVTLRNVAAPQELFEVSLGPARTEGGVDPVCRMWIDDSDAAVMLRHSGHRYWFCSFACLEQFAAEPHSYAF